MPDFETKRTKPILKQINWSVSTKAGKLDKNLNTLLILHQNFMFNFVIKAFFSFFGLKRQKHEHV